MKILRPSQIAAADQFTIKNEPIISIDLMERAAKKCFDWIMANLNEANSFAVFCGIGNNGGDGLAIARMLINSGKAVKTYVAKFSKNYSADFKTNLERLSDLTTIKFLDENSKIPEIDSEIVIDAIFGVGLNKAPHGFVKNLIQKINTSKQKIIAIDMPSGLFAEQESEDLDAIIKANITLTFHFAKPSLLLPSFADFSSEFQVLDIGLHPKFIETVETDHFLIDKKMLQKFYQNRRKFSHKGTYGHSLLIGGSFGKAGAIQLATKAAVKSGSGLVTTLVPNCAYEIMQIAVPEAMVLVSGEKFIAEFEQEISPKVIGIGPGLGKNEITKNLLKAVLEKSKSPLVLDADALNLLSENPELLELLPGKSVLTPHPKEFERLVGKWETDFEKMELAKAFSQKHDIILVLKGAHTVIFTPESKSYFNNSGNSGLATGGSGDVLTGILTGLIAQGYSSLEASLLGIFLHGRAANIAIEIERSESEESFSAGDIIRFLGKAFLELSTC